MHVREEGATHALGKFGGYTLSENKALSKDQTFYPPFLRECMESEGEQLKDTETWTQGMIGRVLVS